VEEQPDRLRAIESAREGGIEPVMVEVVVAKDGDVSSRTLCALLCGLIAELEKHVDQAHKRIARAAYITKLEALAQAKPSSSKASAALRKRGRSARSR
jgi:hypothetical protein